MERMKKIYLAGFDVFSPDAIEIGSMMKQLCADFGFIGMYPLDKECHTAEEIFMSNTSMIRKCDIVAANMNRFRGFEPDSGTSFELGYAYALGKEIYCYMNDTTPMCDVIGQQDDMGYYVENFGSPLNLMISVPSIVVKGGLRDCLEYITLSSEK